MTEPSATPRRARARWSLLVSLLLAAVLLVFALRGVDWTEVLATLRQGRFEWVAAAWIMMTVSYGLRSLRWAVLLSARHQVSRTDSFWCTMAGYLGNSFLPLRAGEVIRSALMARTSLLSMGFVLATIIVERVTDSLALLALGMVALGSAHALPPQLANAAKITGVLGLALIAVVAALPRMESFILSIIGRLPFSETTREKMSGLAGQVLLGLRALDNRGRALKFGGLTMVIWALDTAAVVAVAWAFGLPLTPVAGIGLLAALGLASAAPSTPGSLGIYQFVAVTVLPPFGFTRDQSITQIIAFQAVIYAVVTFWGLIGLWQLSRGRGEGSRFAWPFRREMAPDA